MAKDYHFSRDQDRFIRVFKKSGLSQKEFGLLLGLTQAQISRILNGERNPTIMAIKVLELQLGVNPRWWTTGEGDMFIKNFNEGDEIPILADIPAGDWEFWIDSRPVDYAEERISLPGVRGENLFAIRVKGDSMEPRLNEGDILVLDPHLKFDGGIAVIRHEEGYKIRKVRRLNKNHWLLIPYNDKYETQEITPSEDTWFYVPIKVVCVRDAHSI